MIIIEDEALVKEFFKFLYDINQVIKHYQRWFLDIKIKDGDDYLLSNGILSIGKQLFGYIDSNLIPKKETPTKRQLEKYELLDKSVDIFLENTFYVNSRRIFDLNKTLKKVLKSIRIQDHQIILIDEFGYEYKLSDREIKNIDIVKNTINEKYLHIPRGQTLKYFEEDNILKKDVALFNLEGRKLFYSRKHLLSDNIEFTMVRENEKICSVFLTDKFEGFCVEQKIKFIKSIN